MAAINFDARTVAPQGERVPLPEGEYNVVLTGTEIKSKPDSPQNRQLVCTYKVQDGPLVGQTLTTSIMISHENAVAQRIGQEKLSALCWVTGVIQISDSAQLHGRPLRLKITVDGKYNEVVAFMDASGRTATEVSKGGPAAGPAVAAPPQWAPQQPAPAPAPPQQYQQPAPAPAPVYQPPAAPAPVPAPVPAPAPVYQPPAAPTQYQPPVAPAPAPQFTPPAAPGGLPPWQQAQTPPPPAQ